MVEGAQSSPQRRTERYALATLTGLTFVLVAWMASPLLFGLTLGTVLGFTAQPLQTRLAMRFRHRPKLAAGAATLLGGLAMVGGGAAAVAVATREIVSAIDAIQADVVAGTGYLGPHTTSLLARLGVHREVLAARLREELGRLADLAAEGAGLVFQFSTGAVLTLVVALWTMYYVLVDWPRIERQLERLSPLNPRDTRELVTEFREVGRRAFVGTVATAIVQGVLAGVGFALTGVPQPVTWGALLAILSIIPAIGTLLVWVPAAIWLVTEGHVVSAVVLVAWSLVIVMATNDYFVRPRMVGRGGDAHPLLMLVALLGGISVFGVSGLVIGPVVVSLFVAAAHIYERERTGDGDDGPAVATADADAEAQSRRGGP
jgi:predicted PurR-regulated permease PerM